MAERLKAAVLKTAARKRAVGSNPTLSTGFLLFALGLARGIIEKMSKEMLSEIDKQNIEKIDEIVLREVYKIKKGA